MEIRRNISVLISISFFISFGLGGSLDSAKQAYMDMKYGMFIHFSMATYEGQQWASPDCDPGMFNPSKLDCGQWADVAKQAGMKYMVLTPKHHDGFCLWPSEYTDHDVSSSSWKNGKGDLVREFVDSCRSRGLKVGLYYSIWDQKHGQDVNFIKNQLKELLTNYGPITSIFFDAWDWKIPYSEVPYEEINSFIKSIQPNCLVVNNSQEWSPKTSDIIAYEMGIHEWKNVEHLPDTNTIPSETCETLAKNNNWFWNGHKTNRCVSANHILKLRKFLFDRNCNLLLNVAPDPSGLIPETQIKRLFETKLPYIRIISPNCNENFQKGSKVEIRYESNMAGNLKIELMHDGKVARVINHSTRLNNYFEWQISKNIPNFKNCRIKITSLKNPDINDKSDRYFTIN
ncbi:MAG TPA: alpha-L-fucosidase [bacterium]|nr:alpha-L-fucosidase [bacterium]